MKKFLPIILICSTLLMGCPLFLDREGALLDVNSTSSTSGQYILPADYQGKVSAWYFGHST